MKQELISAYEFADRKNVSHTSVYTKMTNKEIIPVIIGKSKYIDWNKYNSITFEENKGRKKTV